MVGAIVKTVVDWFGPLYVGALGYLVVAGVIFLDRGALTGVVIPGELFLALGGVYAGRGKLNMVLVILVGAFAGICGEVASYWLGRKFGVRLIRHLPLANRLEKHLDEARDHFKRHGGKTVFIGRYISVAGTFMPFAAGMAEMSFARFLVFDSAALTIWATAVSMLGYVMYSQIETVDNILSQFGWAMLALVVLFFGGRLLWKNRDGIRKWFSSKFTGKGKSKSSKARSTRTRA